MPRCGELRRGSLAGPALLSGPGLALRCPGGGRRRSAPTSSTSPGTAGLDWGSRRWCAATGTSWRRWVAAAASSTSTATAGSTSTSSRTRTEPQDATGAGRRGTPSSATTATGPSPRSRSAAGIRGLRRGMGLAVGDYDDDGRPDLYVSAHGSSVLYHNEGGGRFRDVTARSGV